MRDAIILNINGKDVGVCSNFEVREGYVKISRAICINSNELFNKNIKLNIIKLGLNGRETNTYTFDNFIFKDIFKVKDTYVIDELETTQVISSIENIRDLEPSSYLVQ